MELEPSSANRILLVIFWNSHFLYSDWCMYIFDFFILCIHNFFYLLIFFYEVYMHNKLNVLKTINTIWTRWHLIDWLPEKPLNSNWEVMMHWIIWISLTVDPCKFGMNVGTSGQILYPISLSKLWSYSLEDYALNPSFTYWLWLQFRVRKMPFLWSRPIPFPGNAEILSQEFCIMNWNDVSWHDYEAVFVAICYSRIQGDWFHDCNSLNFHEFSFSKFSLHQNASGNTSLFRLEHSRR